MSCQEAENPLTWDFGAVAAMKRPLNAKRLAPVGCGPVQATMRVRPPPSNRSEVCAGMRQYMKCRRPVWRHVKAGGKGCVGRSCDGLLRAACGLATVHSTEKGLPFYIRFI